MKIDRQRLLELIREELVLILPREFSGEPVDSTDAWHPSDVEPLEDAWSGGDNIDTPVDHAYVETGESNAGPHSVVGFSGTPEPLGDEAGCPVHGSESCGCQIFSPQRRREFNLAEWLIKEGFVEDELINNIMKGYSALYAEDPDSKPVTDDELNNILSAASAGINVNTVADFFEAAARQGRNPLFRHVIRNRFLRHGMLVAAGAGATYLSVFSVVGGMFMALPTFMDLIIEDLNTVEGSIRNRHRIIQFPGRPNRPVELNDFDDGTGPDHELDFVGDIAAGWGVEIKGGVRGLYLDALATTMFPKSMLKEDKGRLAFELLEEGIISLDFYAAVLRRFHEMRDELDETFTYRILEEFDIAVRDKDLGAIEVFVAALAFIV